MGLRLRRWWHRDPVPGGRHARVLPVVSVPGAASTLVASAGFDPRVTGVVPGSSAPGAPDRTPPAGPGTQGTAVPPPHAVSADPPTEPIPLITAAVPTAPAPDGRHDAIPVSAAVGLVFADGASVELEPDDPRVRTFRAAAAALLDPPSG